MENLYNGRSRGTENPGFLFFNRGGEPFSFDPLEDRVKNDFSLILRPMGSVMNQEFVEKLNACRDRKSLALLKNDLDTE